MVSEGSRECEDRREGKTETETDRERPSVGLEEGRKQAKKTSRRYVLLLSLLALLSGLSLSVFSGNYSYYYYNDAASG